MDGMVSFLGDLALNNDRAWFHAHKAEYEAARGEFEALIRELMFEICAFDDGISPREPRTLMFKLQRDLRFSHDKTPYNPSFRCHIAPAGKNPVPVGYFLSIRADAPSLLAGGLFEDMFKDATQRVRTAIYENADEFLQIVNAPDFARVFRVEGTALKRVPKEYPPDCAAAAYLKNKSWYVESLFDAALLDDRAAFIRFAADQCRIIKPFNDFLNRALIGFTMPTR